MKKLLSLSLVSAMILTLFSGIGVFADENEYLSAFENFNQGVTIVSNTVENQTMTVEGSPYTYELTGKFVDGQTQDDSKAYSWVTTGATIGYNSTPGIYINSSINNGGAYTGVLNGKLKVNFKPITSGKVFVSYRYKLYKSGRNADFGALYDGDTRIVSVMNGGKLNEVDGNYAFNGKVGSANQTKIIGDDRNWHQISYIADLETQKAEIFVDGTSVGEFAFSNTATKFDSISFGTYNVHTGFTQNYYIDDILVCEAPDFNTRTVSFYKDGQIYQTIEAGYGTSVDFPVLEDIEGKYFSGWYGDANGETSVDLSFITEDTDVYAVYKPYVILEDFGTSTSFRLDETTKTIATNSGFGFTVSASTFDSDTIKCANGILSIDGTKITDNSVGQTMMVEFDEINSGTAEISFNIAMARHNQNGNPTEFGSLGFGTERMYAAYGKLGYGFVHDVAGNTAGVDATVAPLTLTKDASWHKVTYRLDVTNKQYYYIFDGVSYGPYTLGADSVSSIAFRMGNHSSQKISYRLKDVCLILNPEQNKIARTVTYVDKGVTLKTETVMTGDKAVGAPDLTDKEEVFVGWHIDENGTKLATLDCVTKDMTVYSAYMGETPANIDRTIPDISNMIKITTEYNPYAGMFAKTVNGKKLVYFCARRTVDGANVNYLVCMDLTDLENPQVLKEIQGETGTVFVKEDFLIATTSNGYKVYALDENGLPTELLSTKALAITARGAQLFGNDLFIYSDGKVNIFDATSAETLKGNAVATFDVDFGYKANVLQVSDKRYRFVGTKNIIYTTKDGYTKTNDGITPSATGTYNLYGNTMYLCDIIKTPNGFIQQNLFNGVPDLSKINVWPAMGVYGEDSTVEGHIAFAPSSNLTNPAGVEFVSSYAVKISWTQFNADTKHNHIGNDDIIVDVSNPKAPQVIGWRNKNQAEGGSTVSVKIDDTTTIDASNFFTTSAFADYSTKGFVRELGNVAIGGYSTATDDGRAYLAGNKFIHVIDLYSPDGQMKVSPIYVSDKNTGKFAENVKGGYISSKAYLYSPTSNKDTTMIVALYGEMDNILKDVRMLPYVLKEGFNEIEFDVDLTELAHYNAYDTYARVYLWESMSNPIPLAVSKKVNAAAAQGTTADFYVGADTEVIKGLFLTDTHGIGETLKTQKAFRAFCDENDWAIMSVTDSGTEQPFTGFGDPVAATETIDNYLEVFAEETGHPELLNVPIATFGHSNATTFSLQYANHNRDRCFAAVGFRMAKPSDLTNAGMDECAKIVPIMINQGEVDAYSLERSIPRIQELNASGGIINYALDPENSHGMNDWNTLSIIMPFLEQAYSARVPEGVDFTQGRATLKTIDPTTGYLGDISKCYDWCTESKPDKGEVPNQYGSTVVEDKSNEYQVTPYNATDVQTHSWLFDAEYAAQWQEFCRTGLVTGITYK